MDKVWIIFTVAAALCVYNNTAFIFLKFNFRQDSASLINETSQGNEDNDTSLQQHLEEVKKWPKVFVLNDDPDYFIVCFKGVTFNISDIGTNETTASSQSEAGKSSEEKNNIFTLSDDPAYPVICRVRQNLGNITDNNQTYPTLEEGGDDNTNYTCIRRDYEKNVSAIFIQKTGPIELAWNVYNSSLPYGYMTIKNIECYYDVKVLKDTIVDCGDVGITVADKNIGSNTACALCG